MKSTFFILTLLLLLGSILHAQSKVNENLLVETMEIDSTVATCSIISSNQIKQDFQNIFSKAIECERKSEFTDAIRYSKQLLVLINNDTCKNNVIYTKTQMLLASLYIQVGNSKEGILLLNRVIENSFKIDDNSKDLIFYINTYFIANGLLASLYLLHDNFYQAEEHYKNAMLMKKDIYGEKDIRYITSQFDLGYVYMRMGSYTKAELIYERTFISLKELFGDNHPEYISHLSELGDLYKICGNNSKAENVYKQSVNLSKTAFGENSSAYVNALSDLGSFYLEIKDYSNAMQLLNTALKIRKKITPEDYSYEQLSLAILYLKIGDYNQAKKMLEVVLQKDKVDGLSTNVKLFNEYLFLGIVNEKLNNKTQVLNCYLNAFEKLKEYISQIFDFESEKRRESIWYSKRFFSEILVPSFAYNYSHEYSSLSLAYNNILFSRGLLLKTSNTIKKLILNGNDSVAINIYEMKCNLQRQLFEYESQSGNKQTIFETVEAINKLDNLLMNKSKVFNYFMKDMQVKWTDVQKSLKPNEAAIEFISFDYYNKLHYTDSTMYCALVLKNDSKYPEMIPLFEEKQLDSLFVKDWKPKQLYQYRASNSRNGETEKELNYGAKLYNLIWKPLENSLSGVERIFYSPSGTLNNVAFSAIPIDSIHYLYEQYDLHQVTSTREILHQNSSFAKNITASFFGDIQYDLNDSTVQKIPVDFQNKQLSVRRYFTADSASSRLSEFKYLKGASEEVKSINQNLDILGFKSTLYTGNKASEINFKQLSNTNTHIIHIATHGFYLPVEKVKHNKFEFMGFDGSQRNVIFQNPLLRSGLALYGANKAWRGEKIPNNWEDGILTSQEISELNLTQTELVVLSACKTALGDIKGSEGVFGLQRAFKMAGVKSMIVSLWEVDDPATSKLMQGFYKYWLGGMSKHEAFKKAQGEIRALYPDPYYWAAFVMVD